ncbi:MAG: ubiquinol-cytochrome c reductase iron-sulfur subunit [Candidatus Cyclobacteriaceae bacterium M3_2C_046]
MKTTRRDFFLKLGSISLCACTAIAGLNGCSMIKGTSALPELPAEYIQQNGTHLTIDLKKTEMLKNPGDAVKLTFGPDQEHKLIIIHDKQEGYLALNNQCAHGGRELNYLPQQNKLQCTSFGHSEYDLKGKLLKGPAQHNIMSYKIKPGPNKLIILI